MIDKVIELLESILWQMCILAVIVAVAYMGWCGFDYSQRWNDACLASGQSIVGNNCLPIKAVK
jgi:hypothetical protein